MIYQFIFTIYFYLTMYYKNERHYYVQLYDKEH